MRRPRKMSQRRTRAPIARNNTAKSLITSSRMWNKRYKGYRFKLICDELEVDFKPRIKFSAELGGYAETNDLGSK
jgi:hypothetical protein